MNKGKLSAKDILDRLNLIDRESNVELAVNMINSLCQEIGYPEMVATIKLGVVQFEGGIDQEEALGKIVGFAEDKVDDIDYLYSHAELSDLPYMKDENRKINRMMATNNVRARMNIIASLSDDETKAQLLKREIENTEFANACADVVISSFKSDAYKEKFLQSESEKDYRKRIIMTFSDDSLKRKYLEEFNNPKDNLKMYEIVASLKSDEEKLEWMKSNNVYPRTVVTGLKSDDIKLQILNMLSNRDRAYVIASMQDQRKKVAILDRLIESKKIDEFGEDNIVTIIEGINSDDTKLHYLQYLKSPENRKKVIIELIDVSNEAIVNTFYDIGRKYIDMARMSNEPDFKMPVKAEYSKIGISPDITYGIEIEADGEYAWILKSFPKILRRWDTKAEYSVSDGMGIEVTSPILHDCEKDVNEIYQVNEMLSSLYMHTTSQCGGHIHIGSDYLTTIQSYMRLIELWTNSEEILYRICNKPGQDERNSAFIKEAKPLGDITRLYKDGISLEDFKEVLRKSGSFDRRHTLNFANLRDRKNTLEFRIANGTLDASTWIENVRLVGRFVQVSETLGKIDNKSPEERSAEEAKLAFKANAVRNSINSDEKFKNLMELLFPEERYRLAYERRYEQNQDVSGFEKWDTTSFSNLYRGMDWRMKQTNQQGMKQSERQDGKNNEQLEL